MKVILKHPILVMRMFRYVTINEIELRRPLVIDLKGLGFSEAEAQESMKVIFTRISGLSMKETEKIDLEDWTIICECMALMMNGRKK